MKTIIILLLLPMLAFAGLPEVFHGPIKPTAVQIDDETHHLDGSKTIGHVSEYTYDIYGESVHFDRVYETSGENGTTYVLDYDGVNPNKYIAFTIRGGKRILVIKDHKFFAIEY